MNTHRIIRPESVGPQVYRTIPPCLSRREFLALTGGAAAFAFLPGCGGGGGGNASGNVNNDFFTSRNVVVKPNVAVLPEDGTVVIDGLTDTGLTLSGAVPPLQAGQVIVSGQGAGLMRRVTAVTPVGTTSVLRTEDASFADVFESAEISFSKPMNAGDIESVQIGLDGVQIGQPSRSRDTIQVGFPVVIPKTEVVLAKEGDTKLSMEVSADFRLTIFFTGKIVVTPGKGLELLELSARADFAGKYSVKAMATVAIFDKAIAYGRPIVFKPIRLGQAGPVPIVLVNILFLQMALKGRVIGGWETTADGVSSGLAGLRLTGPPSLSNLSTFSNNSATGDFKLLNFFGSFEFEFALWEIEVQSTIDFVFGPKFLIDLPSVKAKLKANLGALPGISEASEDVNIDALFKGAISAKAGALGLILPEYKLTVAEAKLPLFARNFKAGASNADIR